MSCLLGNSSKVVPNSRRLEALSWLVSLDVGCFLLSAPFVLPLLNPLRLNSNRHPLLHLSALGTCIRLQWMQNFAPRLHQSV